MATNDYKLWLDRIDIDLDDQFDFVDAVYKAIQTGTPDPCVVFEANGNAIIRFPNSEDSLTLTQGERVDFLKYLDSLYLLKVDGERMLRESMTTSKVSA